MSDTGRIRSMGPVSLLKVKSAAVAWVLTSQWAIEIARGASLPLGTFECFLVQKELVAALGEFHFRVVRLQ